VAACDGKVAAQSGGGAAWRARGRPVGRVKAVGELGGDAWRTGEAEGPQAAQHGGQRRHYCAAEGEQRKKKGGALGADVKFQKLQGPQ
jgi:hypothetical protein